MKIRCNHFDSKNATFTCQTCRHYNHCSLLEPTNKNHSLLLSEINYWLNKLKEANHRIIEYEIILNEILNGKYTIPVNVYGNIQQAPKQNVYGVFIKKPEHIFYGWNYNKLMEEKKGLIEKIRLLNQKELNMRRILERRANHV